MRHHGPSKSSRAITLAIPCALFCLVLSACLGGGKVPGSGSTPPNQKTCEPTTQTFEAVRIQGHKHLYFDSSVLALLDDPSFTVESVELSLTTAPKENGNGNHFAAKSSNSGSGNSGSNGNSGNGNDDEDEDSGSGNSGNGNGNAYGICKNKDKSWLHYLNWILHGRPTCDDDDDGPAPTPTGEEECDAVCGVGRSAVSAQIGFMSRSPARARC